MPVDVGTFLRGKRALILERWQRRVAALTEALHVSRIELLDHMPAFVDGLIALLEAAADDASDSEAPAQQSAPAHGAQRLQVGFDVDEVIREYGILADVLLEVASAAEARLGIREQRRLFAAVNAGAAEAVREYVQRRDAELFREQARHRAFIAHELRTPLATALVAADLLVHGHPPVAESRPMQLLERSLAHVRDLIDQVLIAGRLDAGVEPERDDVDLAALVRSLGELLGPEAEMRRVPLAFDVPETLHAQVDARLVHSAIANLLRNAIKYTRAGTTVSVRLAARDDWVTCEVRDGCGGITANNWANLFEPFTRGNDVSVRQRDGLGLGLAIAKQAAEAHGGTLAVRNLGSDGCAFEFRLPVDALVSP